MATGKLGYLLAVALMVGVLLASSGAASGQQDGWSPARLGFASEPEQSGQRHLQGRSGQVARPRGERLQSLVERISGFGADVQR
jgi:hypothetical protein